MASSSDFRNIPKDANEKLVKFKSSIRSLTHFENLDDILDDPVSYDALFCMWACMNNTNFGDNNSQWSFLAKSKYAKLPDVLVGLLDRSISIVCSDQARYVNGDDKKSFFYYHLIYVIRKFSLIQFNDTYLFQFSKNLFDNDVIVVLLKILNEPKFFREHPYWKNNVNMSIIILEIILNFSSNASLDRDKWHAMQTLEQLDQFVQSIELYNEHFHLKLVDSIRENLKRRTLTECLDYFNRLNNPSLIIGDYRNYADFLYIYKLVKRITFDSFREFKKHDCKILFTKMLAYLFSIREELDFQQAVVSYDLPNEHADLNEKRISVLSYVLHIINSLIQKSIEINMYFSKKSLVKALLDYLTDERFTRRMPTSLLYMIILNIYLMSKMADETKKDWKDLNTMECLINFLKYLKNDGDKQGDTNEIIERVFFTMSIIVDDEQIENLTEINSVVNRLLEELAKLADYMEKGKKIDKIRIECLNDDGKVEKHEVYCLNKVSSIDLLDLLKRYSVNEKTKYIIYHKIDLIKTIIYKGNDIEKLYALRLLAQLCFNDVIAVNVSNDRTLMPYIRELDAFQSSKSLKAVTENILWSIDSKTKADEPGERAVKAVDDKHIMISYNKGSRELSLKIKGELESLGYKVWIDVDNIHGLTLDAMAKAIEQSFCVLICVSEKYRLSENCQAEAQYAFRLRKPIIPLIVQEGYENVEGWLGFIIGDKIFVNFTKYSFSDCIQTLKKELNMVTEKAADSNDSTKQPSTQLIPTSSSQTKPKSPVNTTTEAGYSPKNWCKEEVADWLKSNEINQEIVDAYSNIDGETLNQIYLMERRAPEFFYQLLVSETNNKIKTVDIAFFMAKLAKLFDN